MFCSCKDEVLARLVGSEGLLSQNATGSQITFCVMEEFLFLGGTILLYSHLFKAGIDYVCVGVWL